MKFAIASIVLLLAACSAPTSSPGDTPIPATAPAGSPELPVPVGEEEILKPGVPQALRVVGTEPFWGLQVNGQALTFTTPENQVGLHMRGVRTEVPGDGLYLSGGSGEKEFSLNVRYGECSDGMSDTEFTMTAQFRIGQAEYTGCAQAADQ